MDALIAQNAIAKTPANSANSLLPEPSEKLEEYFCKMIHLHFGIADFDAITVEEYNSIENSREGELAGIDCRFVPGI